MQMFIELRNDKSSLFESVGRAGGGGGCAFDCESGLCELKEKKKKERKTLLTIESSCVGPEGVRGMCL